MIINIGICEDDKKDLKHLENMLHKYMKQVSFPFAIEKFFSGEELLNNFKNFDILFLDISLEGIDGIQTGNEIKKISRQTKIIYTTSYQEFIEQAVNHVHAFSYIVKPISSEVFKAQMNEVIMYINEEKQKSETIIFDIIEVTKEGELVYVSKEFDINDIYYFEYINRRIKIKLKQEEYYFIKSMRELVDKMNKYCFEHCHQNFLVSLKHIKRIKGYNIFLDNEDQIPVSQRKSSIIRKSLNQYIQSKIWE